MKLEFSIIIPVYNRPQEIDELLNSLTLQTYTSKFEVVVVEDGSTERSDPVISKYKDKLTINYYYKENTGAGLSRNYGMEQANGNYFIIFDSDCIIPNHYLTAVEQGLKENYTDAYGGADAAHESFSNFQKAINYSMTSFFTTGGIRGSKTSIGKFQPRSFNMGISKKAFQSTKGYSIMKIGEDIDLTFRLWEAQFETQFIEKAFVYHKRRATVKQYFKQTNAFGKARPFLNEKFPGTAKLTFWFPSVFIVSLLISLLFLNFEIALFTYFFACYFLIILIDSSIKNKSLFVGLWTVITTMIQFSGYGLGFLQGQLKRFF